MPHDAIWHRYTAAADVVVQIQRSRLAGFLAEAQARGAAVLPAALMDQVVAEAHPAQVQARLRSLRRGLSHALHSGPR